MSCRTPLVARTPCQSSPGSSPDVSLLIVTGPPGAGKSTVAAILANSFERSVLVSGDTFFGFLAAGNIDPWLPASATQNEVVTEAAAAATARFVDAGYDTVYDGVVGPWLLDRFLATAGAAVVDYAILLPSVDACVQRVATRNGHGFTDEPATRKMHHEFSSAAIEPAHVFDNGDANPSDTAALLQEQRAAGNLRYRV